jgi:hypothetical protein
MWEERGRKCRHDLAGNGVMSKTGCYSIGRSLKVSRVVVVDLLVMNGWTSEIVCLDTSEVRVEFSRKGDA